MQMGENQRRGTIGICEESVEFVTERCCVAYRFSKLVICNFVGQVRCRVIIKFPVVFYIMGSRLDTPSTVFWQMNWKLSWRKSSVKTYIRGGGAQWASIGGLNEFCWLHMGATTGPRFIYTGFGNWALWADALITPYLSDEQLAVQEQLQNHNLYILDLRSGHFGQTR